MRNNKSDLVKFKSSQAVSPSQYCILLNQLLLDWLILLPELIYELCFSIDGQYQKQGKLGVALLGSLLSKNVSLFFINF